MRKETSIKKCRAKPAEERANFMIEEETGISLRLILGIWVVRLRGWWE
jgi:hypothetical protein